MYNNNNVFAKIIRGEIPCKRIYENEFAMSFYDANPIFENHALVIPKGPYENILDFAKNATVEEQTGFWACFAKTAEALGIECEFNCLANSGANAPFIKQSVFHFHMHLVAGDKRPEFQDFVAGL
ncbi:MAG: HIT domain-containing protein [Alphaproteobacteria bacterium]|jgi:diadenosine tetraphosphate (Ap4A) HIT family hydrolase|nr:HIT domain-containing protein [Alphaproteobacteria bacterium]